MKQYDIGIDLGTTSIIIATEEQGVVFRQPTIGAVDTRTNSIIAVGDAALKMVGRAPAHIDLVRSLRDGSGLHSHLYFMGGIFTERGIDFMTAEEYRALLDVDFNNVKIEDLTDIRKIKIDKNQPQSKRQAQFLKQVGNPYMLRRGSMMIKVSFANNGLSMEQAFENLLLNV